MRALHLAAAVAVQADAIPVESPPKKVASDDRILRLLKFHHAGRAIFHKLTLLVPV